jgi:hypothetical protein
MKSQQFFLDERWESASAFAPTFVGTELFVLEVAVESWRVTPQL